MMLFFCLFSFYSLKLCTAFIPFKFSLHQYLLLLVTAASIIYYWSLKSYFKIPMYVYLALKKKEEEKNGINSLISQWYSVLLN